jgi:Lrp/AsnC family transcriptional regulator for asnA, asnC and gidA
VAQVSIRSAPVTLEEFDEIDQKIIRYLQRNGRESFTRIGEDIGVPASTVRDRTNRLVETNVLRIVGVLNPLKTGERVMANIGIKLSGGNHRGVAEEISRFDEVSYLVICAGSFDLLVEIICRDNNHLLEVTSALQQISGVLSTETFIYYAIVKEVFELGTI